MPNIHGSAFDELAAGYDERFTCTASARVLRNWTWEQMSRLFTPGDLILDIGCGTGEDARFLAERGMRVLATDVSPAMMERAQKKLANYADRVTLALCAAEQLNEKLPFLLPEQWQSQVSDHAGSPAPVLRGIVSDFGVLNCLPSLQPIRVLADRYLQPGGYLLLCLINRFYFREVARGVWRRFRAGGSLVPCGSRRIPIYYHSPSRLRWAGYELLKIHGLAVFLRSDVHTRWPFNRWGDHYLAVLAKRGF